MSDYQINFGPDSATDWLGANSPARFAARAAVAIDFAANLPVSIARYRGWWLPESDVSRKAGCSNEVAGEDAVHSAIARLEQGGPGLVICHILMQLWFFLALFLRREHLQLEISLPSAFLTHEAAGPHQKPNLFLRKTKVV